MNAADIRKVAHDKFGYDKLRPGQEEVIRLALAGHDTLSVMPTGSGKSAIYQIAALFIDGPTVVVSPLIALQKDQLESIEEIDVPAAAVVNSMISAGARREALEKLADGSLEYLFIAPEQFQNDDTMEALRAHPPSLLVVDEAHCISEWGHDFRPDYARLGDVIDALGHPRVLALTATASRRVQEEIVEQLHMKRPKVVVWGIDRPNIHLAIERCPDDDTKRRLLPERIRAFGRPGIVYVSTRRKAEDLALMLREQNIHSLHYHGGMKSDERNAAQEQFMDDPDGVIVATSAFGMGVDKPDVRFVIHYDVSESIDAYYQEVGRAGRDGAPARALLLYRPEDIGRRLSQASSGKLDSDDVEELADTIQSAAGPVDPDELEEELDLSGSKLKAAINRLIEIGAVRRLASGELAATRKRIGAEDAAEAAVEEQDRFRQARRGRVELMRDYAETIECRRQYLLNYFGETLPEPCGHCDTCDAGLAERAQKQKAAQPIPAKTRVRHDKFGEGTVMRYDGDKIVILFDTAGEKALVTRVVLENDLVERV